MTLSSVGLRDPHHSMIEKLEMAKKPPSPDDPKQSKRFIDLARELGADESEEAFEKAFDRVVSPTAPNKMTRSKKSVSKSFPQKAGSQDDS